MNKTLYIVRGIPGSGKSTLARELGGIHFEADMFFVDENGDYKFDMDQIKQAHEWCRNSVKGAMRAGEKKVVVSNTFTQEWEMDPYLDIAKEFEYRVFTIIVENRHGNKNLHNVPEEIIEKMKNRFQISL
jgi:predicted kinase